MNNIGLPPYPTRLWNAFTRYIVKQFFIFAKFDFVPITKRYKEKIRKFVIEEIIESTEENNNSTEKEVNSTAEVKILLCKSITFQIFTTLIYVY